MTTPHDREFQEARASDVQHIDGLPIEMALDLDRKRRQLQKRHEQEEAREGREDTERRAGMTPDQRRHLQIVDDLVDKLLDGLHPD